MGTRSYASHLDSLLCIVQDDQPVALRTSRPVQHVAPPLQLVVIELWTEQTSQARE